MDPRQSWSAVNMKLWVMYMVRGRSKSLVGTKMECARKPCFYPHNCISVNRIMP